MTDDFTPPPLALDDPALRGLVVERELGGGGMSRLFVALDPALDRRVVIKVLAASLAETLSVDRFRREILLATSLQHPNIVPVLSAGELAGTPPLPFFVMPFVQGESLRDRLLRGPLSVRESVSIAHDSARALAYAHERGVVHRDIKPGNILLSAGAAVVSDFGVAKALSMSRRSHRHDTDSATRRVAEQASLTSIGTSLGTPAYMAPEQAAADPDVDHRADIYALGIVLYEMLVGAPPFHGRSPQELLRAQLSDAPPPIASRRYDVPERLADLIGQCLEKDPARRPKSTMEVVRRLEEPAAVSGAFAMTSVVRRRSRRSLALRALGVVALTGVVGVTALYPSRPDDDAALVPSTPRQAVALAPARTLLIGPLTVIGDAPEIRALVQGLTSELATALVVVPGLRIGAQPVTPAPPVAAGATSTTAVPAPLVAAAAPVPTLKLEGTVQHERGQVRLLLRALDTARDSTLWSGAFDGRTDSLLVFQGRVARSVASALVITLSRPAVGAP